MIGTVPPRVAEAQCLSAELQEALAERQAASAAVSRLRETGRDESAAVSALLSSTAWIEILLLRLDVLVPPVARLN